MSKIIRKLSVLALLAFALAGCNDDKEFNGKKIAKILQREDYTITNVTTLEEVNNVNTFGVAMKQTRLSIDFYSNKDTGKYKKGEKVTEEARANFLYSNNGWMVDSNRY